MTKPKPKPPAPKPNAARKVDPKKWAAARVLWERDVTHDFKSIGEMLGCSRQRVQQKATEDGWRRTADMKHINELAQAKADAHFTPSKEPGGDPTIGPATRPPPTAESVSRPEAAAEERSADLRRDRLVQHRSELKALRSLLFQAINKADSEAVRRLKAAVEATKLLQEGERKAYAMDTADTPPPGTVAGVRITIEREEVKRG